MPERRAEASPVASMRTCLADAPAASAGRRSDSRRETMGCSSESVTRAGTGSRSLRVRAPHGEDGSSRSGAGTERESSAAARGAGHDIRAEARTGRVGATDDRIGGVGPTTMTKTVVHDGDAAAKSKGLRNGRPASKPHLTPGR